jgi:hypothetical protein
MSITQDSIVNDTSVMKTNSIYDVSHVKRNVVDSRSMSETTGIVAKTRWNKSKPISPDERQKLKM